MQGTWAFISAQILQSEGPVTHTLMDDIESAFWVFIYEALLYLKHSQSSHLLSQTIHALFSDHTYLDNGKVTGGREKMNVLGRCSLHNDSSRVLTKFDKSGVNELLNELGHIFYGHFSDPHLDLDLPNDWFPSRLRRTAMKMEPLCITPTGLKSPTNDSNPPDDPEKWEPASVKDSKVDYYPKTLSGNPENSNKVQMRHVSEITSGLIHVLDGSFLSNKRSHISEPADEEEEPVSKKHRS